MTEELPGAHQATDYSNKYLQRKLNISSLNPRDSLNCLQSLAMSKPPLDQRETNNDISVKGTLSP